jgi:plastocyanin
VNRSLTRLVTPGLATLVAGCFLYPPYPPDAGMAPDAAVINGCAPEMFVDLTGAAATRIIEFGGEGTSPVFGYAPQCMIVAVDQTVSWHGQFSVHPLSPGINPSNTTAGSPDNPIQRTGSGTTVDFQFHAAGTYPYFCEQHYAAGMSGVVMVR